MNKRYIAPLLMGVSISAQAQDEVVNTAENASSGNPTKVEAKAADPKTCQDLRDESKDKPFEFGMSVGLNSFFDINKYGAQQKFGPNRIKAEHAKDPKRVDAFSEFALTASKEINVLSHALVFNATVEKEVGKTSLDLSKFFVEMKMGEEFVFVLGNNAGTFCSYVPASDRYTAYQIAFNHKVDEVFSYTIAIEELQGANVRTKTQEEKTEKVQLKSNDYLIDTTTDKKDNHLRPSNEWPKLALAANFMVKGDWGNVQLSALGAPLRHYYGTGEDAEGLEYKTALMYGAALSSKYIIDANADYINGEKATVSAHMKYRDGLGAYHGEAGGLPEDVNTNFCFSADKTKIESNLKTLGFGVASKYCWNTYLYSSLSSAALLVLNKDKVAPRQEGAYNSGLTVKVAPIAVNITKNFSVEPSYNFGICNVIGGGERKMINRVGLSISFDI